MTATASADPGDHGAVTGAGVRWSARWTLRVILLAVGLALAGYIIGTLWVVFLPVFLALALSTVLRPPAAWLMAHRWPPALAALVVVVGSLLVLVGLVYVLAPPVFGQLGAITQSIVGGLGEIRTWLAGPPLNLNSGQIGSILDSLTRQLQQSTTTIAATVLGWVGSLASLIGTALLALVLAFLFVKDGSRFPPWLRRWAGRPAAPHLAEVLLRSWTALGGFVRAQALVGLVDGVLIGLGLAVAGIPLAVPLGVLTFFAAFVPYIGAITAGALAVLVALFSNGLASAFVALAIVVVVQQLEGNVLAPVFQGRALGLHPAIVLLGVVAGWSLFSVTGALLAVPTIAIVAAILNYLREQRDARVGQDHVVTPGGDGAGHTVQAASGEIATTPAARRSSDDQGERDGQDDDP